MALRQLTFLCCAILASLCSFRSVPATIGHCVWCSTTSSEDAINHGSIPAGQHNSTNLDLHFRIRRLLKITYTSNWTWIFFFLPNISVKSFWQKYIRKAQTLWISWTHHISTPTENCHLQTNTQQVCIPLLPLFGSIQDDINFRLHLKP